MMHMGLVRLVKQVPGAGEEQGIQDKIDLIFLRLPNQWLSIGAFVAGEKNIIDYIRYNIRSQIFAKSLPMPVVIGNLKRLEPAAHTTTDERKTLDNARKLQKGLKDRGFDIGKTILL